MYIPNVDGPLDDGEWREFVAAQGFGHLIAAGTGRAYPAVQAAQFVLDGDVAIMHVSVHNPVVAALEESPLAMLSIAGDWAFIPSAWKALEGEDPTMGIPTTYYAAVQLFGRAELVEADALGELLRRQLTALQPEVAVVDPGVVHVRKLTQIRGVRLSVDDVHAKFKYGGNVDTAHRLGVVEHLDARGGPGDDAAVARARRRIEP